MPNQNKREQTYPLLKQGKTVPEVCRLTGISHTTALRHARELDIKIDIPPRYNWKEIQTYYDLGHSGAECCKKFGFTKTAWTRASKSGKIVRDSSSKNHINPKNQNLEGCVFGKLTVIRKAPEHSTKLGIKWECKCDCGNTTFASTANLNCSQQWHCGCVKRPSGENHSHWTGFGEISGAYWGNVIRGAKIREISFGITIEYANQILLDQKGICAVSGVPISREAKTASLDRIDSSKGYEVGNVQWLHNEVNVMKLDLSMSEFLFWIDKIHHFNQSIAHESHPVSNSTSTGPSS